MEANTRSSSSISRDGDPVRITSERSYVLFDKLQCLVLVEQTPVSGAFRILRAHEAERSQTVVDGDDDYFLRGEHVTRMHLRGAIDERTRVEPNDDGPQRFAVMFVVVVVNSVLSQTHRRKQKHSGTVTVAVFGLRSERRC